ncbi:MAG: DNA starvation/stationary phase protection protein [Betaproteobacteria bacterium]|nr:MAG: DNA starvation/stationary phase protection protein [Betaproteobacteria bacterium]
MDTTLHRMTAVDSQPRGQASAADAVPASSTRIAAPEIGIAEKQRQAVVAILNTVLADEFVLYTKTRRFHWNVQGPDFSELHDLFQKQYEQLGQIVDDVAERARSLDGVAAGSLEEYVRLTRLDEQPTMGYDARGMIAALLADHETLIRNLRQDLRICSDQHGDEGTMDFLTALMQAHEKTAWMLRAHLR